MALIEREIRVVLALASGGKNSILSLSGHRVEAIIDNPGGLHAFDTVNLRIFGMKLADMNNFATNTLQALSIRGDSVTVLAGNVGGAIWQVFEGTILKAYTDFSASPDSSFNIFAQSGYRNRAQPIAPASYSGSVPVADAIKSITEGMGYTFVNNGVTARLSNQYAPGSAMQQIQRLTQAAGVAYSVSNKTVSIWPNGAARNDTPIILSAETGMIGYPAFTPAGIEVKAEFDVNLTYGAMIDLRSIVGNATGKWFCLAARHELAAQMPGGTWQSSLKLNRSLYAPRA